MPESILGTQFWFKMITKRKIKVAKWGTPTKKNIFFKKFNFLDF
jgi:hypothetical protein